jgi:hypothetical protein
MSFVEAMTIYCDGSTEAPPLKAMRDLLQVEQGAKRNCSSDYSLDLVNAMYIINMVLYMDQKVDLTLVQGLLKRAMEAVKPSGDTLGSSSDFGHSHDSRGNPYRPATISPFATRQQSGWDHRQVHYGGTPSAPPLYGGNIAANIRVLQDSSLTLHHLPSVVKNSIRECLKAVLVRQRNNREYLKVANCWKSKVIPAVNKEFLERKGMTLFKRLNNNPKMCKELNEFLRGTFRIMQSEWGLEEMMPRQRAKNRKTPAAHAANSYAF